MRYNDAHDSRDDSKRKIIGMNRAIWYLVGDPPKTGNAIVDIHDDVGSMNDT